MPLEKLNSFNKKVSDLADKPLMTSAELKAQFDAAPDEVRVYLNKLIDSLLKTTSGDSGAKNIGATGINGLTGSNVQALLESLKAEQDRLAIGNIQNINLTVDQNSIPSGNTGTILQLLSWLTNRVKTISGKTNWHENPDVNLANALSKNRSIVSAVRWTTQSLSPSTYSKIIFENEYQDTLNEMNISGGRFTPNKAGKYKFSASGNFEVLESGRTGRLSLYKNGSLLRALTEFTSTNAQNVFLTGFEIEDLVVGDYIELYAQHTGASNQNIRVVRFMVEQLA